MAERSQGTRSDAGALVLGGGHVGLGLVRSLIQPSEGAVFALDDPRQGIAEPLLLLKARLRG